jgi:hypothetical protein
METIHEELTMLIMPYEPLEPAAVMRRFNAVFQRVTGTP